MKGIAHFATGIAVASFFPEVVRGAAQIPSFAPLLGGFAALLPDTLDFKFIRYFYGFDEEIDPAKLMTDDGYPDPQGIANQVAAAMNLCYETGKRVSLHLHTLRLGSDLWRQYSVAFDVAHRQVIARIGPVVTTGQVPYPDSRIPGLKPGRAPVNANILHTYDAETKIDILSGPSMSFQKAGDAIEVTFMPWHRIWTHSWVMVLLLAGIGALFAPVYGLVMALAALSHIFEDQLGSMGCNLFFPLTRERLPGLRLMRSGDAFPNFLTVWVSLAVILLNLDRFSDAPIFPSWPFVLVVIVVPCLLFWGVSAWDNRRMQIRATDALPVMAPSAMAAVEALDEVDEVDI
jgi:membrane-bound metal-dependent hydrolase YbcI (DUF457 family)